MGRCPDEKKGGARGVYWSTLCSLGGTGGKTLMSCDAGKRERNGKSFFPSNVGKGKRGEYQSNTSMGKKESNRRRRTSYIKLGRKREKE